MLIALPACERDRPPQVSGGRAGRPSPQIAEPQAAAVAVDLAAVPLDPGVRIARISPRSQRATLDLIRAIQGLESLYASTNRQSPDRAQLQRRIAESYLELEASERDKAADPSHQGLEKSEKIRNASQSGALKYYSLLKSDYGSRCGALNDVSQVSGNACADDVLYFSAYASELTHVTDAARAGYLEIVARFPQSGFVPYAHFALGEMAFEDARSDSSKWSVAAASYAKAAEFRESPIAPHAVSRLDLVCRRSGGRPGPPGRCAGGSLGDVGEAKAAR